LKNPVLATYVIREFISHNRNRFIKLKNKNDKLKLNFQSILDMKEINDDSYDSIVEAFNNLPIDNKNLLVFLFDHITHIIK
jgi:hypothetical protein